MNWDLYPNFQAKEFDCKHSRKNEMRPEFMELLQAIRTEYGKPIYINSGYRDITHPIEAAKESGGAHTLGLACDIGVRGEDAIKLLGIAISRGVRRVGIQQKGVRRYIHIDIADKYGFPKSIWSY
jgi:zinc D-Ala-D-Ala carboxypeptidase